MRIINLLLLFVLCSQAAWSQFYTGGNTSLNFNNGIYAEIAPVIGYRIKKIDIGTAPFISYAKPTGQNHVYLYGERVFMQYAVFKGAFIHAEVAGTNVPAGTSAELSSQRMWEIALPLGAGYETTIAQRIRVQGMVLYDVLLPADSPKENPIFRGGINYSF